MAEPRAFAERCTTRAKPNLRRFNLEVGSLLEPQDAQGWFRENPVRPTRTVSSSSRQALLERRSKPFVGAAGPAAAAVAVDT